MCMDKSSVFLAEHRYTHSLIFLGKIVFTD